MAKRRKEKDENEETDFKIPKFDEKAFVIKEKEKIRATILSFLFGGVISIITFGFWILLIDSPIQWGLVFLFGLFNASWLRYIFNRFKIDESKLERKGQFSSYAIYFLTWLFILIILVNPPFYDGEAPSIKAMTLPSVQETGGSVKIVALVTDNGGIKNNEVSFTLEFNDSVIIDETIQLDDQMFYYELLNNQNRIGTFSYTLIAEDISGKVETYEGTFNYDNNALSITSSLFDDLRSGDAIVIDANENLFSENFRVYYTIDNTTEINVNRDEIDNKERYETSPEYEGWKENTNHSIQVYAEVVYFFENIPKRYNNTVKDNTLYLYSTDIDSNIGNEPGLLTYNCSLGDKQKENTINYKLPCPKSINVPGFEIILFCISLIIALLFFKYKKYNQYRR